MTLNRVAESLYRMSIGGWFNGMKCDKSWLKTFLEKMLREDFKPVIFQIALPDGWWYASATKFPDGEYGYYIPETREDEEKLKAELLKK